jgi:hypothetical protein
MRQSYCVRAFEIEAWQKYSSGFDFMDLVLLLEGILVKTAILVEGFPMSIM